MEDRFSWCGKINLGMQGGREGNKGVHGRVDGCDGDRVHYSK